MRPIPRPPDDPLVKLNRTISDHPLAFGVITVAFSTAALALAAGVGSDADGAGSLTWAVVGVVVFDAAIVWLFPNLTGLAPTRVATATLLFAVAPSLTTLAAAFYDQPQWLPAAGFAVSVMLVAGALLRIANAASR